MPTSFVTGYRGAENHSEPRFFMACGSVTRLRDKLVATALERENIEVHEHWDTDIWLDMFTVSDRQSRTKVIVVHNAHEIKWANLPLWLDKCKDMRLVLESPSTALGERLSKIVKTRGMIVDCEAPESEGKQGKMLDLLSSWFGFSTTKIKLLLHRIEWDLNAGLDLMTKVALLNLDLTSDVVQQLGYTVDNRAKFEYYLQRQKKADALFHSRKIDTAEIPAILQSLGDWIELVGRLSQVTSYYKAPREIATQIDSTAKFVQDNLVLAKKYNIPALNRASIALANADKDYSRGTRAGVLDVLTACW